MDKIVIRVDKNNRELGISGSTSALRNISKSMLDLIKDRNQADCVIEAAMVDPDPYDVCLSSLSISKSNAPIKISVVENYLQIEGDPDFLETFADWFDYDDDTWSGYHSHFDHFGCSEWVDPDSIPLVIMVKNSIKRL